jgi:hypothetical protein
MENITPQAAAPVAAPVSAPVAAPMATPDGGTAAAQPVSLEPAIPINNSMADGGSVDSGANRGFFESLNFIEVGLAILGVASLSYLIFYYRFKTKQDKMINNEMQRQIDEIKMNVQGAMGKKYKAV